MLYQPIHFQGDSGLAFIQYETGQTPWGQWLIFSSQRENTTWFQTVLASLHPTLPLNITERHRSSFSISYYYIFAYICTSSSYEYLLMIK